MARVTLEGEICFVAERRGAQHVEAREDFELEKVPSCRGGEPRRRAQLDFCSGGSFDDHHRSATLGAAPKVV